MRTPAATGHETGRRQTVKRGAVIASAAASGGVLVALVILAFPKAVAGTAKAAPREEASKRIVASSRRGSELRRAYALARQGDAAVRESRLESAASCYRSALEIEPRLERTLVGLADALDRQGKLADALQTYHSLMFPTSGGGSIGSDPVVHMRYVVALTKARKWEDAKAIYDRAMSRVRAHGESVLSLPTEAKYLDHRGLVAAAHLVLGGCNPAHQLMSDAYRLPHLEEALKLRPNWAEAHYERGRILAFQKGREREGLTELDKAAALGDDAMKQRVNETARGPRAAERYRSRGLPEPAPLPEKPATP